MLPGGSRVAAFEYEEDLMNSKKSSSSHGLKSTPINTNILNDWTVRETLKGRGISIPDDCRFLPGTHNTTTDEISLHDMELVPSSHLIYIDRLNTGLTAAARRRCSCPGMQ